MVAGQNNGIRRALGAGGLGGLRILLDFGGIFAGIQTSVKLSRVQTDFLSDLGYFRRIQTIIGRGNFVNFADILPKFVVAEGETLRYRNL